MKKGFAVCLALFLCSCGSSKSLAPVYTYGVNQGVGSLGAHTVQKGDSVWTISQKYNLDLRGIIEVNHLSPPYALVSGSRLNLPAPNTYTVRGKDNLYTVSRLFSTTQTELASLNRLSPPYKLGAGQVLKIPNNYVSPDPVSSPAISLNAAPAKVEAVPLPPSQIPAPPAVTSSSPMPPQPDAGPVQTASSSATNSNYVPPLSGKFLKPINGKIISSFGTKSDGQHNDGINIQAIKGDPVQAAENGTVVYVGNEIEGYGNMILLRHKDQYMTAYAHMAKTLVKKGEVIKRGQTVGTVGSTGFVDKPQLHFEIRKGKKAIDPSGLI